MLHRDERDSEQTAYEGFVKASGLQDLLPRDEPWMWQARCLSCAKFIKGHQDGLCSRCCNDREAAGL